MGRTGKLTSKDLKRLKRRYNKTTQFRHQWAMLKEEFGYRTDNGLWKALKRAGVVFTRNTKPRP